MIILSNEKVVKQSEWRDNESLLIANLALLLYYILRCIYKVGKAGKRFLARPGHGRKPASCAGGQENSLALQAPDVTRLCLVKRYASLSVLRRRSEHCRVFASIVTLGSGVWVVTCWRAETLMAPDGFFEFYGISGPGKRNEATNETNEAARLREELIDLRRARQLLYPKPLIANADT